MKNTFDLRVSKVKFFKKKISLHCDWWHNIILLVGCACELKYILIFWFRCVLSTVYS